MKCHAVKYLRSERRWAPLRRQLRWRVPSAIQTSRSKASRTHTTTRVVPSIRGRKTKYFRANSRRHLRRLQLMSETLPQFWALFNIAPRRIQEGGWARQVTQADFQIASSISGVNMRLDAGGIRELHWHQAAEWAFMSYGNCRVTVVDPAGRA